MSIQSNFPSSRPALLLDFANTKQLDSRITFTRASTANYYDGKTATKAEQNFYTYSEQFDNAAWTKTGITVTANSVTAPDGTTTADTLTAGSGVCYTYQSQSQPLSVAYTLSVYLKYNNKQWAWLELYDSGNYQAYFDIQNGVAGNVSAGATSSITYVGNGWYRCSITRTVTTQLVPNIGIAQSNGSNTLTDTGNVMYAWGAQLEQRSTVSAYTATTSVPITNYIPTLQSAASGVARFDSNPTTGESLGLLIEESRTNLVTASAQFETPVWTKYNTIVAGNVDVAPDGTLTASKVIADKAVTTEHLITRTTSSAATAATYSVYMKMAEYRYGAISVYSSALGTYAQGIFDLQAGTASTNYSGLTATITAVGDGWYRCSVSGFGAASGNIYAHFGPLPTSTYTNYIGDGYSGIYAWGAQLEAGSSATSYVATPLTFTSRASSATYLGPNGYITSATTNTARNQTNSVGTTNLLLESAASNLLQYTNDFENGYWTKNASAVVATNATQAPDGSVLADNLVVTGNGGATQMYRVVTASAGSLTSSIYVKYISGSDRDFFFSQSGTTTNGIRVTLSADGLSATISDVGSNVTGSGSVAVGGGWHRVYFTLTVSAGTFEYNIYRPSSYGSGNNIFSFWGAQAEAGSTATSCIPSVETWSSRASAATYYNSSGVLTSAASGASRTTYNPALLGAGGKLLLENSATNICLYSEQFDNASWTKSAGSVTANATTAPDGNATADKFIENASSTYHYVYTSNTATGAVRSFSVYAKAAERTWIKVDDEPASALTGGAFFNLASGTIGTVSSGFTASMQSVGNGWYRCTVTVTTTNGVTWYPAVLLSPDGSSVNYAGNGTSGVYLWGAQVEYGAGATSYIATTSASVTRAADTSTSAAQSRSADVYSASTVTRAADAASMTGTNFSSWYVQTGGTMYSESAFNAISSASNQYNWSLSAGSTSSNCILSAVQYNGTGRSRVLGFNGSTLDIDMYQSSSVAANTFTRLSTAIAVNNYATSKDGATGVADTAALIPTVDRIYLGADGAGTANQLNGTIKKIAYYPLRVTDAQLQALTS